MIAEVVLQAGRWASAACPGRTVATTWTAPATVAATSSPSSRRMAHVVHHRDIYQPVSAVRPQGGWLMWYRYIDTSLAFNAEVISGRLKRYQETRNQNQNHYPHTLD